MVASVAGDTESVEDSGVAVAEVAHEASRIENANEKIMLLIPGLLVSLRGIAE
jgi:hypothetical protein